MAHTPGPWIAQNVGGKGWFIVTQDDLILAMTLKGDDSDEADARLVAASPELLAALEAIVEWLCDNGPVVDDGITHPLFVKANNLARAAIAKAAPQAHKDEQHRIEAERALRNNEIEFGLRKPDSSPQVR